MKKLLNMGIVLCSAAVAIIFCLLAGPQFIKLLAGPQTLQPEENFADAVGKYVTYEAAYPVASWTEEYYSGDSDRVRTTGYVIYDVDRDTFFCTVVPDENDNGFSQLLRGMTLAAEIRAGRDMSPIAVSGSFEPAGPEQTSRAIAALEESTIVKQYNDFLDSDAYMNAYFEGDEYGSVLAGICAELLEGRRQTEWYLLEQGSIQNRARNEIWICILAAFLNLLIFVFSFIGLFRNKADETDKEPSGSGSAQERFLQEQRLVVNQWCRQHLRRGYRTALMSVVICLAIFAAIGVLVHAADRLLVFYIPLGLLLGEVIALIFWFSLKGQAKADKIIKRLEKQLQKELPDNLLRNEFIEEFVNAQQEWAFQELTKDGMQWGKVGKRFWSCFTHSGNVTVVDAARLQEIETETTSGTVYSGKVRIHYVSYAANFYYRSDAPGHKCDKSLIFNTKDGIGSLMTLARRRAGDHVRITSK